ncbi:MAG: HDOD domain-containing protein [Desulfomonilia bacterium]
MKAHTLDVHSVPVLPELADHVIRMALEEEVSVPKIAGLIEKDQSLTARILSLANSSYYKRSRAISTVRDAIVLIGIDAVRTLALGLSVVDMFPSVKDSPLDHKQFWRHSMACALFAQAMMESVSQSLAPKAFCAGLLHDIGKMVLDRMDPDTYAQVISQAASDSRPLVDVEQDMLGTTHAEVGREVLSHWKLPRFYEEAVWSHHAPVQVIDEDQFLLSGIVHIANILTHMASIGASGNNFPQTVTSQLLTRFNLSEDVLDEVMERVPRQIDMICEEIGIGKPSEGLFHLVNRASTRLADISLRLQQAGKDSALEKKRALLLVQLLERLNTSAKIPEALEKTSQAFFESGLADAFLGGIHTGDVSLVYQVEKGSPPRILKVNDEELKGLILSGNYQAGMNLPSGVFVHFTLLDTELAEDGVLMSSLIGSVSSCLRRIHAEDSLLREHEMVRKALKRVSDEKLKAEYLTDLNRELLDASPFGLCLLDEENRVRAENEKSKSIRTALGIDGHDIVEQLLAGGDAVAHQLKDAIISRSETHLVWAAGEKSFRFVLRVLAAPRWQILSVMDITKDLEEQKRTLAYAKMSVVGNLAASMAHNMKSPLGAIHGFSSIIRDDLHHGRIQVLRNNVQDQDFTDMISNIFTASENVLKIVNQLLNFTRKWESPESDVDVYGFLEGIFQLVKVQAGSSGITLKHEIGVETIRIKVHALEQVLMNLLMNAINASSQGSEVVVQVKRGRGDVQFSVIDHGIGMDQAQIEKIFDPLYTAWPLKTGMGLGLSLARDIVDSLGGEIQVYSKPGEGSTFTVSVPEGKG